jgi:hypothetical protein
MMREKTDFDAETLRRRGNAEKNLLYVFSAFNSASLRLCVEKAPLEVQARYELQTSCAGIVGVVEVAEG